MAWALSTSSAHRAHINTRNKRLNRLFTVWRRLSKTNYIHYVCVCEAERDFIRTHAHSCTHIYVHRTRQEYTNLYIESHSKYEEETNTRSVWSGLNISNILLTLFILHYCEQHTAHFVVFVCIYAVQYFPWVTYVCVRVCFSVCLAMDATTLILCLWCYSLFQLLLNIYHLVCAHIRYTRKLLLACCSCLHWLMWL